MAPREVDILRAYCAAIVTATRNLSHQLEDLHVYAYDRPASGEVKVAGGDSTDDPLSIGNERARAIWGGLEARLKGLQTDMVALNQAVANLLSAGPSAEETRGTDVQKADFKRAIKRQSKRASNGEYTPHRMMEQPSYPKIPGAS